MKPEVQITVYDNGDTYYHIPGKTAITNAGLVTNLPCYHREDGPAVIKRDGYLAWWRFGKRHRFDGPAIVDGGYSKKWFLFGKQIDEKKYAAWCSKNGIDFTTMTEEDEFLITMKYGKD